MILRARVLGDSVNHASPSFLPPPTFIQSKNYFIKNYSVSFIFAFQEHQKCVIKGCVHYIFAILFCMSKRKHFRNKEKCFLFHFEKSFNS